MHDPHVEALHYTATIEQEDNYYVDPPPVDWTPSHGRARYRLEDGILSAWPAEHCSSPKEARDLFRPDLKSWEENADLEFGPGALRFRYKDAIVIDLNPKPSTGEKITIKPASFSMVGLPVTASTRRRRYPPPPNAFNIESAIVQALMTRYRRWKGGQQDLEHFAYYCAALLRPDNEWRISDKVLKRLQTLSSYKGGPHSSRKPDAQLLSQEERRWMEKAIPAIIRQVAAVEAGATPPELTMAI